MEFGDLEKEAKVTKNELMEYIMLKLSDYDNLVVATGAHPPVNPYVDPITYSTSTGKLIDIPQDLQQMAVKYWGILKFQNENNKSEKKVEKPKDENEIEPVKKSTLSFIWFLAVIGILILIFYFVRTNYFL